jgi:hypothetical protein
MFQTKFVGKIKTDILYSVTYFFRNCAMNDVMYENIVDPDKQQMALWHMHVEC